MLTRRQCSSKCPSRLEVDTGRLSKESFTNLSFCETSKASNVSNNFIERSDSQFSVARNSDWCDLSPIVRVSVMWLPRVRTIW